MPSRTAWLWLFVCMLGITAVLGMAALLVGQRLPFGEELISTTALLTGYSLLGLVASLALHRAKYRPPSWAAAALLAVSLAAFLTLIWADPWLDFEVSRPIAQVGFSALLIGLLPLHAELLLIADFRRTISRWTRRLTIAAALVAVVLCLSMIWDLWDWASWRTEEWVQRLTATAALPAALGTLAVPILARIESINRKNAGDEHMAPSVPVTFICPRCKTQSEQRSSSHFRCPKCRLGATITLDVPQCECGYPLLDLPEPVCPECGRPVPEEDWQQPAASPGNS